MFQIYLIHSNFVYESYFVDLCFIFVLNLPYLIFQRALNYFVLAAETGNGNAMAFLGKVRDSVFLSSVDP